MIYMQLVPTTIPHTARGLLQLGRSRERLVFKTRAVTRPCGFPRAGQPPSVARPVTAVNTLAERDNSRARPEPVGLPKLTKRGLRGCCACARASPARGSWDPGWAPLRPPARWPHSRDTAECGAHSGQSWRAAPGTFWRPSSYSHVWKVSALRSSASDAPRHRRVTRDGGSCSNRVG